MTQITQKLGQVTAVVGAQWGDEGKGKLVDILAKSYDIVARATGGANAGHTIYLGDKKFVFHLVPAGMLHEGKVCVMGNGMVVHLPTLLEEIDILLKAGIKVDGRLFLSDRAHLVFEYHKLIDKLQEELKGGAKVGTTGRGIGPAYSDKTSRIGIRAGELLNFAEFEKHFRQAVGMLQKMYGFTYDIDAELKQIKAILPRILPLITDSSVMLDSALASGKTILMEGANGVLLDIDHGTYPFVTSSNASLGGILAGSGVASSKLKSSIGIMKAYFTRVGSGPFPTELNNELGEQIRTAGAEFGATTGRPRRCGWFDAVAARYSQRINGYTAINLTKIDVLNSLPSLKIGVAYKCANGKRLTEFPADLSLLDKCEIEYEEMPGWQTDTAQAKTFDELPENCKKYILRLEQMIGAPIMFIGTGQSREKMIVRAL